MISKHSKWIWQTARAIGLIGVFFAAGCKGSSEPPGSYRATTLVTTTNGQATDHLANGSTITLVLTPEGTTSGHAIIAPSGGVGALDEDLTGTWATIGDSVNLDHRADTFLRDMPLKLDGNTLVGDKVFQETRIQLTLTRE